MISEPFQDIHRSKNDSSYAKAGAHEKIALDRLNGFVGSTGCRVHLLGGMDELRRLASRMFSVSDKGSPESLACQIEALGRDVRRTAARAFVARHHPLPDDLFPSDARARLTTPPRLRKSQNASQTIPSLIRGETHSRRLEVQATRLLSRHRPEPLNSPTIKVVEPAPSKLTRAKRRRLLDREARKKVAAGIALNAAERWEIERRERQKLFRQAKRKRHSTGLAHQAGAQDSSKILCRRLAHQHDPDCGRGPPSL